MHPLRKIKGVHFQKAVAAVRGELGNLPDLHHRIDAQPEIFARIIEVSAVARVAAEEFVRPFAGTDYVRME